MKVGNIAFVGIVLIFNNKVNGFLLGRGENTVQSYPLVFQRVAMSEQHKTVYVMADMGVVKSSLFKENVFVWETFVWHPDTIVTNFIDPSCIQKGQDGICDFYQCFEERRQCGSSGYLTGYGYKYCNKFGLYLNKFTQAGQTWIACVRRCLTRKLIEKYEESVGPGQQCEELKTYAFDTHVSCYLDCGFCGIVGSNKLALNSVYDYSDLLSLNAIKQMSKVIVSCLG